MFRKILIANRGEIACRIAATARRMGIGTVAVYSDADVNALHVAACDEAVHIGPSAAQASYLSHEKIIQAAIETGAQAIHPGYGFLSESAKFATACDNAGLVFIGPPASAIAAMGSKSAAKSLMQSAGVPLVPGYHGDDQTPSLLQQEADRIGYPVLLKASAGGGGKGMRIVERHTDFQAALVSCKRESQSAFNDDRILIERYLQRSRHVEVQVFADSYGHCIYLFDRDCSVQRRHQKVLEEAPAPEVDPAMRIAMGEAAVAAARAVNYVGAGTVEFIVDVTAQDDADKFYFMEMNTRLQVEHPVTEMITGVDLVAWQLQIAHGESLPLEQRQLTCSGHAIEARLYAENPLNNFLPSTGTLLHARMPEGVSFSVGADVNGVPAAVRIDSGVETGDVISEFYDPMIGKLIAWGVDRAEALVRLSMALGKCEVVGVATNIGFLQRLVKSAVFHDVKGQLDTTLIARNADSLLSQPAVASFTVHAFVCAVVLHGERRVSNSHDPWSSSSGWRAHGALNRNIVLFDGVQRNRLTVTYLPDGYVLGMKDGPAVPMNIVKSMHPDIVIRLGADILRARIIPDRSGYQVFHNNQQTWLQVIDPLQEACERSDTGTPQHAAGSLAAPMSGRIVAIMVTAGDKVALGTPLIVMEAMKMEHTISAPQQGMVERVMFAPGDQVSEGTVLVVMAS